MQLPFSCLLHFQQQQCYPINVSHLVKIMSNKFMMIEQQINITKQRSVFSTIPHIEWKMQFGLKSVMSEFHAWNWKTTIVRKTIPPTSMNVIDRRAKNVHTKAIFKCPTTDSQQMQTMKRFNDVKHNVEWSEKQKHLHWIQNLRLFPCQNDWFYTHTERER